MKQTTNISTCNMYMMSVHMQNDGILFDSSLKIQKILNYIYFINNKFEFLNILRFIQTVWLKKLSKEV